MDFVGEDIDTVKSLPLAFLAGVYVLAADGHAVLPDSCPISCNGLVPGQYDPVGQSVHVVPVPVYYVPATQFTVGLFSHAAVTVAGALNIV